MCQITQKGPLLLECYKSFSNKRRIMKTPNDISEIDLCHIIFLTNPVRNENYVKFPFNINTKKRLVGC